MGLYLYCLVPPDAGPPAGLGLADAPVSARPVGPLVCWISVLDAPLEPSVERIRRHNEVVQAALELGSTPLPVRYGQWLADEAALEAVVREHESAWVGALASLRHTVEYGLRVLDPAPPAPAPAPAARSGTAYLLELAAQDAAKRGVESRGREIAMRMHAVLGSIVRQERIEALPSRHGLVSIAHLIERDCDAEYHTAVEDVRRQFPELRFLVTGPWPPYSFAP